MTKARSTCHYLVPFLILCSVIAITLDTATTQYTLNLLVNFADFLLRRNYFTLTIILFSFGVFTPLVGFPFTLFPLLCGFVYDKKTKGK